MKTKQGARNFNARTTKTKQQGNVTNLTKLRRIFSRGLDVGEIANQGIWGGDQYLDHGAISETHNCMHLESKVHEGNHTYSNNFEHTTDTPIGEGERAIGAEPVWLINEGLHHLEQQGSQ